MSNLTPIYAPWGNNAEAMAQALNVQGVTVRQWRNRGSIPPKYWPAIIDAAAGLGHEIAWTQFIVGEPAAKARVVMETHPTTAKSEAV